MQTMGNKRPVLVRVRPVQATNYSRWCVGGDCSQTVKPTKIYEIQCVLLIKSTRCNKIHVYEVKIHTFTNIQ